MKASLILFALLLIASLAPANEGLRLLREGNRFFEEENYARAGEKFSQALEQDPGNTRALFNLGNSLYRQGRLEEAAEVFETLNQLTQDASIRADALHNLGNSQLGGGNIRESIESYKESLRLNPEDEDTRYNLAYAMNLLEETPPEHGESPDEAGDEDKDDEQREDLPEGQEEEQQPGDDRPGDDRPEDGLQDTPPHESETQDHRPDQLTREEAERILDALNRQEQRVQEQVERKADTTATVTPRRNW